MFIPNDFFTNVLENCKNMLRNIISREISGMIEFHVAAKLSATKAFSLAWEI